MTEANSTRRVSSLAHDPARPVGLVLSGGGARGAFQVGVWEILSTDPRGLTALPHAISGTSAGALNGALIAAGLSPEQMLAFWLDLAHDPPVVANEDFFRSFFRALIELAVQEPMRKPRLRFRDMRLFVKSLKKHSLFRQSGVLALILEFLMTARFDTLSRLLDQIHTSYLFDTGMLKERLKRAIGGNELRQTRVKLAINTVDVKTGKVLRIVNAPPYKTQQASRHYRYEPIITLEMIMASAAIPILFNPVVVNERHLWDGGLLVNTPLAPAVSLGAKRIIPVLVTVREHSDEVLRHLGGAIEGLADAFLENAYNIDRKLLLERNTLASFAPELGLQHVELYRALRPAAHQLFDAGSYLFFERQALLDMYDAGKQAAMRWLSKGPELDSREQEE